MAGINRLSVRKVETAKTGRHADGGGLYLNVGKGSNSRSWVFVWKGKRWITNDNASGRREMGLGSFPTISLAKAREAARECKELVAEGIDPKLQREREREAERLAAEQAKTFEIVAYELIEKKKSGWRNEKHGKQWLMTVHNYCAAIKDKQIAEINEDDVLEVLKPLWASRHETARRVLGRITNILDYAIANKLRPGPNPATWKGNIEHLIGEVPADAKIVKHHAALDYDDMPAFFTRLQTWDALAARALTLLILTATRTSEVLNAEWHEFDLDNGIWIVPAHRMKMNKAHAIPLSDFANSMLNEMNKVRTGSFVFEGNKRGKPLSNMSMLMLLRRNKVEGVTAHGFRSTFRDWCQDKTSFESRIAENALAHSNPDKVEAAYLRSSAFGKRKQLMEAWSDFCNGIEAENVVRLHGRK